MSTVPVPAGAVAVIDVEELIVGEATAFAPNFTALTALKLVPVIVTEVPPASGPFAVLMLVTLGSAVYVYLSAEPVADVSPALVTVISTVELTVPAGAVAVICVDVLTVNDVALVDPN